MIPFLKSLFRDKLFVLVQFLLGAMCIFIIIQIFLEGRYGEGFLACVLWVSFQSVLILINAIEYRTKSQSNVDYDISTILSIQRIKGLYRKRYRLDISVIVCDSRGDVIRFLLCVSDNKNFILRDVNGIREEVLDTGVLISLGCKLRDYGDDSDPSILSLKSSFLSNIDSIVRRVEG